MQAHIDQRFTKVWARALQIDRVRKTRPVAHPGLLGATEHQEDQSMASTTSRVAARSRAREALAARQAERRKRDERMEKSMTAYFAAQDALVKARADSGQAVSELIAEGESRASIAEMLGTTTREIKRALDDAPATEDVGDVQDHTGSAESSNSIDQNDKAARDVA